MIRKIISLLFMYSLFLLLISIRAEQERIQNSSQILPTSNPIVWPEIIDDEFLYVTQMEAEIIRWTLDLYKGGQEACGIVTSGGTESIILALLAYREKAKAEKGITQPNVIMSETAHCAFDKGGHYFGLEIRKIPMTKDFRCDVQAIKRAMDSNTVCLVGSAPEYAFGNFEPIAELAAIA